MLGPDPTVKEITGEFMETVKEKTGKAQFKKPASLLNIYYYSSTFQGAFLGLNQFVLLFMETGFINTIPSKINLYIHYVLLSAICSLIFLQSKGGKRQTLWKENTKSREAKRGSAKADVSKVVFLDIGKITNLEPAPSPTLNS